MVSISILEDQYMLPRRNREKFEEIDDNRNKLNNFEIHCVTLRYKCFLMHIFPLINASGAYLILKL